MTSKEISDVLDKHAKWLCDEDGGERADLSNADLSNAYLSNADLRYADLRNAYLRNADLSNADLSYADLRNAYLINANLRNADLRCANLSNANLSNADLSNAYLSNADLRNAHLRYADLSNANLRYADLSNADLSNAENIPPLVCAMTSILPAGELVGWKTARGCLVELRIPADARRSNSTGRKCRCDRALVTGITDEDGNPVESARSGYDSDFVYRVGETVEPDGFDEDRWDECTSGIHFYITKEEALDYANRQ